MQQYIYGDIGHGGYGYVSSEPEFFADAHHSTVLQHLVTYDMTCEHGDMPALEHQSYWMVSTDLDKPGEPIRLYLQVSGGDGHRSSYYAMGYMSDREDGDLYGPAMLDLLKIQFPDFDKTMAIAQAGNVPAVDWRDLPRNGSLTPVDVEPELLRSILLALLQNKRVILRLPETGRAAVAASRNWLLAIYARLPYEKRREKGFVTGISASKLFDQEKTLPKAVQLVLMDGDADMKGVTSGTFQAVFDLADPAAKAKIPPMLRENKGKPLPYVPFIDFLAEQPQEELDAFFRFSCGYSRMAKGTVTINDYMMYLDFFNIGRLEFSPEQIRVWSGNVYSGKYAKVKDQLYDQIAQNLEPEKLADYLCGNAESYGNLDTLGVLDKSELGGMQDNGVRDENSGLSLRMTEHLLKRYGNAARDMIGNGLARRFLELAYGAYPGLDEEKPTAATLAQLKELPLYDQRPDDLALVATVKQGVREFLAAQRSKVEATYAEQTKLQNDWALAQIAAWNFASLSDFQAVEGIYAKLQNACYLYDELVSGWHGPIAGKILDLCGIQPQTLEDHGSLVRLTQDSCNAFAQRGGKLTEAQQKTIGDAQTHWNRVLELDAMPCATVERLLDRFDEITRTPMAPALALQMKAKHAAALAAAKPEDSMILANAEGLCTRAMDPAQRELLKDVVAAAQGLNVVTEKKTLSQTVNRLSALAAMNKVGLYCEDVDFRPWGETAPAEALLNRIAALKNYKKTSKPIRISDRRVQQWILRMFPENAALLLLLAKQEPGLRSQLVQKLARLPGAVTEADLRELYVSGCSRSLLKAGAGKDTAPSWQEALEALFPKWPSLPQPLQIEIRTDDRNPTWVIVAAAVLLALAAALPGGAMVLLGGVSKLGGIVLTAVLTLAVIAMLATALLLKQKAQKTLAWALCGALVPGLVLAVVSLLLTIL